MTRRKAPLGPLLAAGLALPGLSVAQRADENAVTAAEDAFGTTVGRQTVGLYSEENARGFSPRQAGNVRIEGLYFDQQTFEINSCMSGETTMRVGIAAQSYNFPAPTGVADLSLRIPGNRRLLSAQATRGPFDGATVELEAQLPVITDRFAADVCAGYRKDFAPDLTRQSHTTVLGSTLRWQPAAKTEIIPFWGYTGGGARRILPVVYVDGVNPPPDFRSGDLGVQDWTTWSWNQVNFGVIARSALSDRWTLAAGVFHSSEHDPLGYDPYLTLIGNGLAEAVMDVAPPIDNHSTSGEMRLARLFSHGNHRQQLQFSVRGRAVEREFGGDWLSLPIDIPFNDQTQYPPPAVAFGPANHDSTRQLDVGLTFDEHWQGVGSFAVGVLKDHYRRTVKLVQEGTTDIDTTDPWLVNARLAVNAGPRLIFYGSYVQGLEDSAVAPTSAQNRNEPPPATRTWQVDGGLRYAPFERLQLIFGAFEIHKPYFNTDAANVYHQLGQLQYRGLETSLSYNDNGLTVLLGGVWLQPRVELTSPDPNAGEVPLGPVPLSFTVNLDYAPPQWGPWGASVQWNRLSSRVSTTNNAYYLPALDTVAAGIRYHWTMRGKPWDLRLDAYNLTDAHGLHLTDLEVAMPEQGRRIVLTLATDQ